MPYIGRQPPATALTSADFAAGAVGTTALANAAVTSKRYYECGNCCYNYRN